MNRKQSTDFSRMLRGAMEGAGWGVVIGLLRGVRRSVFGSAIWYEEIPISVMICLAVAASVFAIGRGISGRVCGAWIGLITGTFAGMFVQSHRVNLPGGIFQGCHC